MEFKKFGSKYVLRMDKGEEIVETLKKLCEERFSEMRSIFKNSFYILKK